MVIWGDAYHIYSERKRHWRFTGIPLVVCIIGLEQNV